VTLGVVTLGVVTLGVVTLAGTTLVPDASDVDSINGVVLEGVTSGIESGSGGIGATADSAGRLTLEAFSIASALPEGASATRSAPPQALNAKESNIEPQVMTTDRSE